MLRQRRLRPSERHRRTRIQSGCFPLPVVHSCLRFDYLPSDIRKRPLGTPSLHMETIRCASLGHSCGGISEATVAKGRKLEDE